MIVKLIQTPTAKNALIKTVSYEKDIEGDFKSNADLINPVINVVGENLESYNYVYIDKLKRYYFIDKIEITRKGYFTFYLHIDVLMTYAENIKSLYGIVTRQENANPYYKGYITAADVRQTHEILNYENNFNEKGTLILLAIKGVINNG